jgi:septin family protein
MARQLPNIDRANSLTKRDRTEFRNFVTDVIIDTFIYKYIPTSISYYNSEIAFESLYIS